MGERKVSPEDSSPRLALVQEQGLDAGSPQGPGHSNLEMNKKRPKAGDLLGACLSENKAEFSHTQARYTNSTQIRKS